MMLWIPLAHAASPEADIVAVLDDLHRAASEADEARYFGHFTTGAVFIGTDPTERWPIEDFRTWAAPRFASGTAWTYTPVARHVSVGPRSRTAWFDEQLEHAKYGVVRGSGALVREGRKWKVAHYVLSFAIPNDVAMHAVRATQGDAMLPTPFTAAQIRDAMPVGAVFEHERQAREGAVVHTRWTVREADAEGCTIAYATVGEDGEVERTHAWTELRDHARFEAPFTTVVDERIDSALGPLDCRRYTLRPKAPETASRVFWFCPAMPGAPVRVHTIDHDVVVQRMQLVRREMP